MPSQYDLEKCTPEREDREATAAEHLARDVAAAMKRALDGAPVERYCTLSKTCDGVARPEDDAWSARVQVSLDMEFAVDGFDEINGVAQLHYALDALAMVLFTKWRAMEDELVRQRREVSEVERCRRLRERAKQLVAQGMACNCDLDNWEPEKDTGHSWVCRIHKAAHEGTTTPEAPLRAAANLLDKAREAME